MLMPHQPLSGRPNTNTTPTVCCATGSAASASHSTVSLRGVWVRRTLDDSDDDAQ